ncbi:MAG: AbiV family abortive infection protein [Bacteroidota bacterium]
MSTEAMRNAVRLHLDSILLFSNKSFPSSFSLAVLALEEVSKSDWIDHYVFTSETNHGLPTPNGDEEQEFVKYLYLHSKKQKIFANQQFHEISHSFYEYLQSKKLDLDKQKSIYVGLERVKGKINTKSKISLPTQTKSKDAKKIISLNNEVIKAQCKRNIEQDFYYGPYEKYEFLNSDLLSELSEKWKHKSGIYGKKN